MIQQQRLRPRLLPDIQALRLHPGWLSSSREDSKLSSRSPKILTSTTNSASINPLNWVRDSFAVSKRKESSQEELEAARKADAAEGKGSIFDDVAETVEVEEGTLTKKYNHVCHC